jgi:ElaB/YqjD/DUF883 family membrane-anchored ribosome-binding protein
MNTTAIRDSVDSLKETARGAYEDLKTAAHDRIVDPLTAAGRSVAGAARHGAETAADYSRRGVERTESWITTNPFSAVGVAFGTGLIAGIYLLGKCRR